MLAGIKSKESGILLQHAFHISITSLWLKDISPIIADELFHRKSMCCFHRCQNRKNELVGINRHGCTCTSSWWSKDNITDTNDILYHAMTASGVVTRLEPPRVLIRTR